MPDKEFEIAEEFNTSGLGGRSLLFKNNVGIFFMRDNKGSYNCISEMISNMNMILEQIPENSKIIMQGMRFVLETKEDISRELVETLNQICVVEGTSIPDSISKDPTWCTTIFMQMPDYWEESFDEFLKTYPEFMRKYCARASTS